MSPFLQACPVDSNAAQYRVSEGICPYIHGSSERLLLIVVAASMLTTTATAVATTTTTPCTEVITYEECPLTSYSVRFRSVNKQQCKQVEESSREICVS